MMKRTALAPAALLTPRPLLLALVAGLAFAVAGLLGAGGALSSTTLAPGAGQALAAGPLGCPPGFIITASPNISNSLNTFYAVAARAPGDVWAVGNYDNGGILQTLTARYNGTVWAAVPSLNQGGTNNTLQGVAAVAPDDAWAVGGYGEAITQSQTLIEHWNGSAWSLATPAAVAGANGLLAVSAVGANDIWAVGSAANVLGAPTTLTEHWNGSAWSRISSPNGVDLGINVLTSVAASATNDVWAAGFYTDLSGVSKTLIEHWNGSAWSVVSSPNSGTGDNALRGIVALAADDAWAVGSAANASGTPETLIEHWNGSTWTIVSSPNNGTSGNVLQGVSAVGANDIWAAGFSGGSALSQTLVLHWNGSAWSIVTSPNNGAGANTLYGIAALAAEDVWAVGSYADASNIDRTLALHYTAACITPTPTVTPGAPPSPTATPPPGTPTPGVPPVTATATPVASATPCPIQFTDVPPSQPFYAYIRCLACRGIVAGYSDNTFRPGNNVTRGQMAKFVSNAAGYNDAIPATQQTFRDVPPADPFWLFIERAALHGVISGYSDGTFRPTASVTRGQAAKFIANSAGYTETIPATQQSFTDVLPVDTFWLFIERVKLHDVISGYTCGAPPAGLCDAQNRPYFLAGNPVTRGQTAKFIANSFFPNCVTPDRR